MHVRVKICGITTPDEADLAATLGADMVGLNFYAKSPRFISAAAARSILDALPESVEPVALFVDAPNQAMQQVVTSLKIGTVQIHGEFSECLLSGTRCIVAFSVRERHDLQEIMSHLEMLRGIDDIPHAILVDAHIPGMYGGTGQTAPWDLLADFKPGVPLILAGGLTPENVADAIRIVRPYAVDVASGVESSPGKKDADKMRRFIDAVRGAM